jgi:predicted CXXCH cytochrome family protein
MSNLLKKLLGVGLALALPVPMAYAGIANSKHDLTSGSTGGASKLSTGTEICVFCHTPHGSNTNVAAPLWNKGASSAGFTTYSQTNSSTMDSTVNLGGISLACLSCHDGVQAMDNMINRPGSGLWDSTMAGVSAGYVWSGTGTTNVMEAGIIANLGKDLTNDHPISIPYCGGGMASTGATAGCNDKDFNAPSTANISGTDVYWFNLATAAGSTSGRNKTDILLYGRSGVQYVECASCHDPHSAGGTAPATFLRSVNTGSQICLACHNK